MELRQYLGVLRPHWKWIVWLAAVAAVLGLAATYIKAPTYVASVTLQILPADLETRAYAFRTNDRGDSLPFMRDPTEAVTQGYAEAARSLSLAQEVAQRLGMEKDTGSDDVFSMLKGWARVTYERAWAYLRFGEYREDEPLNGAARRVRDNLAAKPVKGTYFMQLEAKAKKSEEAASMANVAAQVFAETLAQNRVQGLSAERKFLEEQMTALDDKLTQARNDVLRYAERNVMVISDEQIKQRLNLWLQTAASAQGLDAQIQEFQAKLDAITPQLDKTPATATRSFTDKQQVESNKRVLSSSESSRSEEAPSDLYERLADARLSLERELEGLRQRRAVLRDALEKAEKELAAWSGKELPLDNLIFKLNLAKQSYTDLDAQHQALLVAESRPAEVVRVVDGARPPLYPGQPIKIYYVGIALAASLVLGATAAFVWEYYKGTIHGREQLEQLLGKPILATVPSVGVRAGAAMNDRDLPVVAGGSHEVSHTTPWLLPTTMIIDRGLARKSNASSHSLYQVMLTDLKLGMGPETPAMILVTSPCRAAYASLVVAGLGLASVGGDTRSLLVDGNLRAPNLGEQLGIKGEKGLADVLSGSISLADAVQRLQGSVDVLATAHPRSEVADIFSRGGFRSFSDAALEKYETVLISAPPLLSHWESLLLASVCKRVVLVVARDMDTEDEVLRCAMLLRRADATNLGTVLVK